MAATFPGIIIFLAFFLMSSAVFALLVLDLYLGSTSHVEKLRDKNKVLNGTKDH